MRKPKCEPIIKHKNPFAVLADTDSDDDLPAYAPLSPNFGAALFESSLEVPVESPLEAPLEAPFEVSEPVEPHVEVTAFRVWKNDATRFSSDTNNIFSSPFSRKRNTKKDEDGWTSIESGAPIGTLSQAQLATSGSQEFPSMLNRGDVADALAWADKVKTSLEKARTGQRRNLSFFRRTIVLDEKF